MQFPETTTGRVSPGSDLPIRMVTLNDARLITTAIRAYLELAARLHEVAHTTALDADVVDRLERVLLELDAPA